MPKTFTFGTPKSLVASARKRTISTGDQLRASARIEGAPLGKNDPPNPGNASRGWQQKAWQFYDEVGEAWYSANFVGNCASRCTLTIGVPDSDGHIGPAFDENGDPLEGMDGADEALALVRRLRSKVGGQAQLLRSFGINLSVAGEAHLVGQAPEGPNTPVMEIDEWEVLSTEEFRLEGSKYKRMPYPGATKIEIEKDEVHACRVWRSHPKYSVLADSAFKAQQDILEELVLLTREVRGEALSRLSRSGLLLVPEEIEWPDDEGDDGQGDAGDTFTRDLIDTMSTAISDKHSAAGMVPFVIRAPAELLKPEVFRLIDMSPKNVSDSASKRAEAVLRFAQGIDLPVEVVTGHAGTTFANAVQIDDALFKSHIEPLLEIICDALTAGYLRPALGDDTPFVVYYDSTELVARPNRSEDAKDTWDRFAISNATLRAATGFSDSDAPDEAEIQERIYIQQSIENRNWQGDGTSRRPSQQNGGQLDQGKLTDGNDTGKVLNASLYAVAEVVIDRAIERAGARLRSRAHKDASLRASLAQVPNAEVAVTLGSTAVDQFMSGDELFHGEFDTLRNWVCRETADARFADSFRDACADAAAQRLYSPREPFAPAGLPVLVADG